MGTGGVLTPVDFFFFTLLHLLAFLVSSFYQL